MTGKNIDEDYGKYSPVQRITSAADGALYHDAKRVLDQRCVVCHACYDAPCQLQLGSLEGIDRGATTDKVYDKYRLLETPPTRLFEDAKTTEEWRNRNFHAVLNERNQNPVANLELSLVYQLLSLKKAQPLPDTAILSEDYDLRLTRGEVCPKIDVINEFKKKHPAWGMPYGLPAVSEQEFSILEKWLAEGALMPERQPLPAQLVSMVDKWEAFFNGNDLKDQLVSRYLFEHLYLAHLYFDEVDSSTYFKLVRSSTPPGQPIRLISSRRPYDDPGVSRVYYRLQQDQSTVVAKTHMPFALDARRYRYWYDLFFAFDYEVLKLPDYTPQVSSNPFVAFADIPMRSRYMFLLDEAQYSIMNFIKGPVCRGQIALDVIDDHFWVFFVHPDMADIDIEEEFIAENSDLLRFPAYWESNGHPLAWMDLAAREEKYIKAKVDYMKNQAGDDPVMNLDLVWDGYGFNDNAALTVFRHKDSATVVKGLVGAQPKTAWLIDYPLLERIHYLLVAGFDVNGNLVHQLTTRLYMDFLRMEAEAKFIALLPEQDRIPTWKSWYVDAEPEIGEFFGMLLKGIQRESMIEYKTGNSKQELMTMLAALTSANRHEIGEQYPKAIRPLAVLNELQGANISYLPQIAIMEVAGDKGETYYFTLIHNNAHKKLTYVFREDLELEPESDTLTIAPGVIAAYPNAFYRVNAAAIPEFIESIRHLASEQDYFRFVSSFGIRRTSRDFWVYSDRLHDYYRKTAGVEYGLLDFNRLENR